MHQYYLINEVHKLHPVRKVFLQKRAVTTVRHSDRIKRLMRTFAFAAGVRSMLEKILFRRERRREYDFEKRRFFPNDSRVERLNTV